MINTNIYDSPISEQISQLKTMIENEHDKMVVKAIQQVGIEINKDSLIQAINNDRKRYEDVYKKGYANCEEHYKKLLLQISRLILQEEGE